MKINLYVSNTYSTNPNVVRKYIFNSNTFIGIYDDDF